MMTVLITFPCLHSKKETKAMQPRQNQRHVLEQSHKGDCHSPKPGQNKGSNGARLLKYFPRCASL